MLSLEQTPHKSSFEGLYTITVDMVNMSYLSERDFLITFIRYLHTPKERLQEHDTTEIPDKVVLQSTTEIYHQKLCRPIKDVFT